MPFGLPAVSPSITEPAAASGSTGVRDTATLPSGADVQSDGAASCRSITRRSPASRLSAQPVASEATSGTTSSSWGAVSTGGPR